MKKWLLLCMITVCLAYAQPTVNTQKISELTEDLGDIISPEDNETLGGLIGDDEEQVMEDEGAEQQDLENISEDLSDEASQLKEASEKVKEASEQLGSTSELDQAFTQEMENVVDEEMLAEDEQIAEGMKPEDDDIVTGFLKVDEKAPKIAHVEQEGTAPFDIQKKKKDIVSLVKRAAQELRKSSLDIACNRFTHTKDFINGELYVFVYSIDGICLAHGEDAQLLWKNLYNLTDWVGTPLVQDIIRTAKDGGGWVTYGWHNATKVAYVELVEKEGIPYVIGSGFYPQSKEEAVVNLVKGGVALFNKVKKDGNPADWAFSRLSYPSGSFAVGNLYLYALDFSGTIMAQGERPGLIGSNAWDYKDEKGMYVNREIVKKLKTSTEGIWVSYTSKRATKKAYAERVKAKDGKEYFIACGYYPDADREQTIDLVRKAYQFMKTTGKTSAVEAFSQRRDDDYRYGDLFVEVYDLKGSIIADGGNADNIGQQVLDVKDEDGFEYIKSMLKRATKQGVWVNAKIKGSFRSTFAQKIDLGVGQYVIASSYYPISKSETMILLVQSAEGYLKANTRERAFEQFVKSDGQFRRGDLEIVAVDSAGLCYAYGNDYDVIWRNIYNIKDEKGKPFIQEFITSSQQGSVSVVTHLNNAIKYNYVTSVEKDGKTYIISSGYYQ